MELLPECQRIPGIPSPMGQLTVKHHPDGFPDTIMLFMPRRRQRDHSQRSGLDPRVRATDPRPSFDERIMLGQLIGSTGTMNTGRFE
jgi:hypothetical protein